MDKKQKHLPNPPPSVKLDFKTQNFINIFQGLLLSAPSDPPFTLQKICQIISQKSQQIKLLHISQLVKKSTQSVNIMNFALVSSFKILITSLTESPLNTKISTICKVWEIVCNILQKIIKLTQDPDNSVRSQSVIFKAVPFDDEFINCIIENIIRMLLIQKKQMNQFKIAEFFTVEGNIKEKLSDMGEIMVIQGYNQIMKLYTLILCMKPVRVELIIILTTIFQRDQKTNKQLRKNIYKLQKWLIKRRLTLCNIYQLLELIKHPERQPHFINKNYLLCQNNKRFTFDTSYQPLIPGLLSQLCNIQDTHQKKQAAELISFLTSKFCLERTHLIEPIFQLYHNQNNQEVLESMFKYIEYHFSNQISIKKMKFLLQFIKDQSSFYKQQTTNKQTCLYKLKKFVELLVTISEYHLQQLHVIQFIQTSSIYLKQVSLTKQIIVMFIQITRYQDKMRVISLDFNSKQKLHIMLQLNNTGQHTKREVVVIVESINNDNSLLKTQLLKQSVAYQNDNVKNQFLFVLKIFQGKLQLCVNSSYFELTLNNFKSNTAINIQNIQIGRIKNKKTNQNDIPSFKGRLKMFYIFDKMNQSNIAFIFPQFTQKLKSKLSQFTKTFQIQPIIKMVKGEKQFVRTKAALTLPFLKMSKYEQDRSEVQVNIISPLSQIIEQLESYDIFLYLISELDDKLERQSTQMICDIFNTMRYIAINDQKELFLKWIEGKEEEKQLMGFSYFLLLLFRKQPTKQFSLSKLSNEYKQHKQFQQKLFAHFLSFIFCYQEFEWYQANRIRYEMLEIEIIVRLLLNFQIWAGAVRSVQLKVLKELEKRLKNKRLLEMIKSQIIQHHRKKVMLSEGKIILSHKKFKSNNRILNSLLMALLLYNRSTQLKQSNFISLNTSTVSIATSNTFTTQTVNNQWIQEIETVQFKIAELIQKIISIPNQSNRVVEQEILISQVKTILFCIIQHYDKNQVKNTKAIRLLLNFLNVKITEQSRYLRFFIKDTVPFYNQSNCLLIALLIKTLPQGLVQILKMVLQILNRLIIIIKQKCQKHKQEEIENQVTSRFIRQALRGYSHHKVFDPDYLFCFLNWIIQNNYDQKHISFLLKHIRKHGKNRSHLDRLEYLLQTLEPKILVYLTSNIDFQYIFQIVIGIDKQYQQKALILANKLFSRLSEYNYEKANQFYNMYLQINCPYPFSPTQNVAFSRVHSFQDQTYLLSICQHFSSIPNLRAIKSPNDIVSMTKQILLYLGGTLSHHLIKCEISAPLLDKFQSISNVSTVDSYYSIDNLAQYFAPDYIFSNLLEKCISENKLISYDLLNRSLTYVTKFKDRIAKNIQVFYKLQSVISEFTKSLSQINSIQPKTEQLEKQPQNIELTKIQELKKLYIQLCFTINEQFIKETRDQCPMANLVINLLECKTVSQLKEIIKQYQDEVQHIHKLIKFYSMKDMIWANKYYQISLNCYEKTIDVKDQQSSGHLKSQLEKQANEIVSAEQQQIDNNFLRSEQEWKKIVSKNLHWAEKGIPQDAILKIDLHECPSFYHLNVKRTKPNDKRKIFPRKFKQKQQEKRSHSFVKRQSIRDKTKTGTGHQSEHSDDRSTVSPPKRSSNINPPEQQTNPSQKYKKYWCEYVTQRGIYFGKITFNSKLKQIEFVSYKQFERPSEKYYQLSTSKYHRLTDPKIKLIKINQKCCVFTRRYILRHTALEIFTEDKSFFFNLFIRVQRDQFLNSLKKIQKIINRKEQFVNRQYTNKWESGQINNFEYLMWINRYSGRTYNDLSQFPVFPWVIADYKSQIYSNQLAMRNLQLPMGKLNPQRFEGYQMRMKEGGFSEEEKFLYGTFYSNPTVLYNFFIRLEPFLTLHWDHQGQKIDHADRLFSGIEQQYSSAINNTSDVKELTPEFYYWPEFLKNRNQFELGKKQKGDAVNDVILPAWAKSPEEFIFKMRIYLESKEVTQSLHLWIDLIFGDKSQRKAALDNGNLFHPLMYQMDKDIFTAMQNDSQIEVAQLTISQFGQVPQALFTKPHVKKNGRQKMHLDFCQLSTPQFRDAVKLLPCSSGAAIVSKKYVTFVSSFVIEQKNWKQCKLKPIQSLKDGQFKYYSYCIIDDQNHIFSELAAGRLSIYQGSKKIELITKQIESITHVITKDLTLITSVRNKLCFSKISSDFQSIVEKERISGHNDRIYKIVVNEGIDIVLSVDTDNLVLIHYLSSMTFIRDFQLKLISDQQILQIRIHDMGYFLFLTSQSRILLYSYIGDLLIQTDFVYPHQNQYITNIRWMSQYHPFILLSSSKGYIYKVSWLVIYKQSTKFPYRQYVLQKEKGKELLHQCANYVYNDENLKGKVIKKDDEEREIVDFFIIKGFNQNKSQKMTYILMVLYKSGHLRIFREMKIIKKNFETNPLFNKMTFTST